jgi:pyruvate,water dikinase
VERHPEPLTALGASLAAELIAGGLSEMSASCGGLIERFEARTVGGELYMRVLPVGGHDGPPPPWWVLAVLARVAPSLRRRMRAAERILEPGVLDGMRRGWYEHSRPHLEGTCARLRAVALEELDDAALATHLEAAVTNLDVALGIHFRLIPACLVPVHDLISACRRLLGWPDARTLGLLAGTSEATSAPVRDLDALAREVRTDPAALALVQRGSSDPVAELTDVDPRLGAALEAW